jgi:hypothetical protein
MMFVSVSHGAHPWLAGQCFNPRVQSIVPVTNVKCDQWMWMSVDVDVDVGGCGSNATGRRRADNIERHDQQQFKSN